MGASCGRCSRATRDVVDSHLPNDRSSLDKLNVGTADMGESPRRLLLVRRTTSKQKGAVIDSRAEVAKSEVCEARVSGARMSPWEANIIAIAVQRNSILTNLTEDAREGAISAMKGFELDADATVFEQGKPAANFFVVSSGTLEVLVNGERVRVVKPGDSFGELALLNNAPRSATVRTLSKVMLWGLDRKTFREVVRRVSERNYHENLEFLNSVPLFNVMTAQEKEHLLAVATVHRFTPGTHIVCEGESGDLFYLIKEGVVSCTVNEVGVRKLLRGDYFGEQALLYNVPRTATVTAMGKVKVLSVRREQLKAALGTSLQRIIYRNTQRIVLDKSEALRALTAQQKELLIDHIEVSSFQDSEVVIPVGVTFRDSYRIVLRGQLKTSSGPFASTFAVVGEAEILAFSDRVTTEPIMADDYTDIATISREKIEQVLGGNLAGVIEKNEALSALQQVSLFRTFSAVRLEQLLKVLTIERFADKELIVSQNDEGSALYIVKKGEAHVVKNGIVLRTVARRGFFGERSVLLKDVRTASVVASGECECWVLHQKEFAEVIDEGSKQMLLQRMELQDDSIQLSDLLVVKSLGKGSFGNVHLVIHREKKTLYALKSVHRRKIGAFDLVANLQLERQLLLQIDHVFVMKLVKTFKDEQRVYFLAEFVNGRDLFDVIRVLGLLKPSQGKFYTACLLLILEHLHELSIIYRDLKPENVMVDAKGYLKLIDFGIAKQISGRTFTIVGTPHYMAPEVVQGKGYALDADLWSLGVMLFEFLAGSLPFGEEDEDPFLIYSKIMQQPLDFPPNLAKGSQVRLFIESLLNKNPALRAVGGIPKLKEHKWFSQFQWVLVTSEQLPSSPSFPLQTHASRTAAAGAEDSRLLAQDQLCMKQLRPPFIPCTEEVASDNGRTVESALLEEEVSEQSPGLSPKEPVGWDKDF